MDAAKKIITFVLVTWIFAGLSNTLFSDDHDWPQWRGPFADGSSRTARPPIQWSETENIRWKVPIPGEGLSSPIISGNNIFISTAIEVPQPQASDSIEQTADAAADATKAYRFVLLCYDLRTGAERWRKLLLEAVPHESKHATNSYASASPVTDGQRVYVSFGSRGYYCVDFHGELVWQRDLGDMQTRGEFGEGSSPALHRDSLIIVWDHEGQSYITRLNKSDGATIWKTDRQEASTWATPLITEFAGVTQIVTNGTQRVRSYDFDSGKLIWECGGQATNPIPSPVRVGDCVVCMTGYQGYAVYSIPLSARGDVTDSPSIKWKRTDSAPYVASPVLYRDQLYYTKSRDAILTITNATTGESIVQQSRLPIPDLFYASPVAADNRIYLTGRNGATVVLEHGSRLKILAVNQIAEGVDASMALVDDQIIMRSEKSLYCIGPTASSGPSK